MENRISFYLDDFRIIKLYVNKTYSDFSVENLKFFCDGKEEDFKVELIFENDEYMKYQIDILDDYDFEKKYSFRLSDNEYNILLRHIVSKEKYDNLFYYEGNDLGCFYSKEFSVFKVWSPCALAASLLIDGQKHPMVKKEKGVFEIKIFGDFDGFEYKYHFVFSDCEKEAIDPYAYSCNTNARSSIVVDQEKIFREKVSLNYQMKHYTDAIIYELSVRDFTMHKSGQFKNKGKFLSLIEEKDIFGHPIGFNYLKDLAVTHVQLMPIFDFASYDEEKYLESYNWGYDPLQYNVLEGSYLTFDSAYNRIEEFQKVVNHFHKNDIRVNLDVVFNHVYDTAAFSYERINPYYCFRYFNDESLSNGSFCGNELRSEAKMLRKYIVDMCTRYVKLFDIDGLRFDLMGLTDIETMNEIYIKTSTIKKDFMIYGEGWDLPSVLSSDKKAMKYHNYKMPCIAFFNDVYRDVIKGATMLDNILDCGFSLGDNNKKHEAKKCLLGSSIDGQFSNNTQSVNYIECHDNMTFYDKVSKCLEKNDEYTKKKKIRLALGILLVSQGIPFLHCGIEFLRTKKGHDNTYNMGDDINAVDWYLTIKNSDLVRSVKDLISIRKTHKSLRLHNNHDIFQNCKIEEYYDMLIYRVDNLNIFINNTENNYKYPCDNGQKYLYYKGKISDVNVEKEVEIESFSMVITTNA